ncbi:MAG: hypothetical protein ACHQJ6_09460, partial [Candidatus Berkiellales bacterium]
MLQHLYGLAIFTSAFLLFFVQPLLAKHLLPLFGGSAFVWIACVLFFQAGLMLGYAYAYFLARYFCARYQAWIHIALLVFSFYFIPISSETNILINHGSPPVIVMLILSSTIFLPFMVLSASSPLLQHWYCTLRHTTFPYYFYAISNTGSLLGLLGYPFLLEPLFGIKTQISIWSAMYGLYVILCLISLSKLILLKNTTPAKATINVTPFDAIRWLILTFLSSALLLAITQFLSQNVFNFPLMWIVPLALYLITYIITFSSAKPYDRSFWLSAFIIWLSIALWIIFQQNLNGIPAVIVFLALLFSACMICHGELIRLKPHQQDLTLFYLFIALGGMLGGLFTNAVLLLLLTQWWDFYVPMIIITLLVVMLGFDQLQKAKHLWNFGVASMSVMVFLALLCAIFYQIYFPKQHLIAAERSLYGFLRVFDDRYPDPTLNDRRLMNGTVIHGLEYQDPAKKLWPTLYYGWNSGAGIA